jgi:branched-chain amino acid transport system substrate-binding protein
MPARRRGSTAAHPMRQAHTIRLQTSRNKRIPAGPSPPDVGDQSWPQDDREIKSEEVETMNKTLRKIALVAILGSSLSTAYAEELLVGVELPLTGSLARVGMGTQEGIKVAAEVFNKTNGKHTVKLVTVDDESAPAKAIAAVEQLANQHVLAITGGYGSNNISPASDAANKLGLVYITSGGVDDSLVNSGRKTFFRINNTAGYQKALVGLVSDLNA